MFCWDNYRSNITVSTEWQQMKICLTIISQTFWLASFLRNKSRWRQMSLIGVWPSLPWATNANTARTFCLPMLPAQCSPLYGWTIGRDQTWMLVSGGVSTGETKFGETIWRWQYVSLKLWGKSHIWIQGPLRGITFSKASLGEEPLGNGKCLTLRVRHIWSPGHWEASKWGRVRGTRSHCSSSWRH